MDQQQQSMKMVFVLLVSAILCGVATFLAVALVMNRSATPPTTPNATSVEVMVAGTSVALYPDAQKIVLLASELSGGNRPEIVVTETPPAIISPDVMATPTAFEVYPTPSPLPPDVIFIAYTVPAGDTLYRISQNYNTSIDLMAIHGISSHNLIAGNSLSLPVANPAYCPAMAPYVVREAETVFSIAQRFGTTSDAIASANNLDASYRIKTAQVLCIP